MGLSNNPNTPPNLNIWRKEAVSMILFHGKRHKNKTATAPIPVASPENAAVKKEALPNSEAGGEPLDTFFP